MIGGCSLPSLTPEELALLRDVLSKRRPDLLSVTARLDIVPLTAGQLEDFRNAVLDELLEFGLGENDEPTPRGVQLDKLIDRLRHVSELADEY
jgi:hypothetical protein